MTNSIIHRIRMTVAAGLFCLGAAATALAVGPTGGAEAHSGSFWAGYHYDRGATCFVRNYGPTIGQYHEITVRSPVIYATPNDGKSAQPVSWRPRLVVFDRINNQWVNAYGKVQAATAWDTSSATGFTDQTLMWDRTMPAYVYVDFFFYSTTTGYLAEQGSHYLGFCS